MAVCSAISLRQQPPYLPRSHYMERRFCNARGQSAPYSRTRLSSISRIPGAQGRQAATLPDPAPRDQHRCFQHATRTSVGPGVVPGRAGQRGGGLAKRRDVRDGHAGPRAAGKFGVRPL